MSQFTPIPQPDTRPILANVGDIDPNIPVQSLMKLAEEYGEIFRLSFPNGRSVIFISSQELVHEIADEARFEKKVHAPLESIRDFAKDGLFTAYTHEDNWGKAHRILMPAFGPMAIRDMFPKMVDIADQLMLKWERFGEQAIINITDDMTRLTLDTIALCGFDYRFNSFYQDEMHPFVDAMVNALDESGRRDKRLPLQTKLMMMTQIRYKNDINLMNDIVDAIITERKADPKADEKNDLLARMLTARDPQTGEGLSDENIRYQLITFLIAGHETTSGLLSFTTYQLLKNPEVMAKARAEVDEVLQGRAPEVSDIPRMRYIDQIMKESLRIWPTAPAFGVYPHETTTLAGKYEITPDDTILVVLPMLHRDPMVWGDDPERFDPERFTPEAEADLPDNAYMPFGRGQRACIGRPFALQEAALVLISMLQRFDLSMVNPNYVLDVKETLTLKPEGFQIRVKKRQDVVLQGRNPSDIQHSGSAPQQVTMQPTTESFASGAPLLVLYGSESGSSQAFAERMAAEASGNGFSATLATLDSYVDNLPTKGAVAIVTASYEGQPTHNAKEFVDWLDSLDAHQLKGVTYSVFGCGNKNWVKTYQRIPRRIDEKLAAAGAKAFKERGEADANADFFGDFEVWYQGFWQALGDAVGQEVAESTETGFQVNPAIRGRASILRQGKLVKAQILENRELITGELAKTRSKRHIRLRLSEGMTYKTGDYLSVLPSNSESLVQRVLKRFNFSADDTVVVESSANAMTNLPTEHPVSVSELLRDYVELHQPINKIQLAQLVDATRCPPEKHALQAMLDSYDAEILTKRVSVLELLERFEACELSFAAFLNMMPSMRMRQYSISSSAMENDQECTLTLSIVHAPALSGQGSYQGIASTFLAHAEVGSYVPVAVKESPAAFQPPADPSVPMIMACAGTGLAPFYGFIAERALQKAAGQEVATSLLFFGCEHPDDDFLYKEQLMAWQAQGIVKVRNAFNMQPDGDIRFVQHRLWHDRADVVELFRAGATMFVCGDGKYMAPAVRETCLRIYQETKSVSEAEASAWGDETQYIKHRYVADVFA